MYVYRFVLLLGLILAPLQALAADDKVASVPKDAVYRDVNRALMQTLGGIAIRITACFGVAEYTDHSDHGTALMNAADEAMYAAKDAGRNRVVVSSAQARRGKPQSA